MEKLTAEQCSEYLKCYHPCGDNGLCNRCDRLIEAISQLKEYKDAEEQGRLVLRQARWIWGDDGYLRCSDCNQKAPVTRQYQDEPETTATNYCPNCGAKMEGTL